MRVQNLVSWQCSATAAEWRRADEPMGRLAGWDEGGGRRWPDGHAAEDGFHTYTVARGVLRRSAPGECEEAELLTPPEAPTSYVTWPARRCRPTAGSLRTLATPGNAAQTRERLDPDWTAPAVVASVSSTPHLGAAPSGSACPSEFRRDDRVTHPLGS